MTSHNIKLMLVDDDKDILQTVKMGLELEGFEVHEFTDSIQALNHIERDCKECKAIVSDINMPNINGFQLARSVKELRPDIKVVLMSAFEVSMSEFKAVFPSTHVDTVLKKPFLPSRLAEMIRQLLPMEKVT